VSEWSRFLLKRPMAEEPPEGWLSLPIFAKQVGTSENAIRKALVNGRLDSKMTVTTALGKGRRRKLWISPSTVNGFRELVAGSGQTPRGAVGDPPVSDTNEDPCKVEIPEDLAAAKLLNEQLKIAERQAALRIANNEVIKLTDVVAINREIAAEFKAAVRQALRSAAPEQVRCKDVSDSYSIGEEHMRQAFEKLQPWAAGELPRR